MDEVGSTTGTPTDHHSSWTVNREPIQGTGVSSVPEGGRGVILDGSNDCKIDEVESDCSKRRRNVKDLMT